MPVIPSKVFGVGRTPEYIISEELADLAELKEPFCASYEFALQHIQYTSIVILKALTMN